MNVGAAKKPIDPRAGKEVRRIPTGASVRGLVSEGTSAYVTTRSLVAAGHRGGTLHVTSGFLPNHSGIDPSNADVVMGEIPDSLLPQFREFLSGYQGGKMVTNYGQVPSDQQVQAAIGWLARTAQPAGV